jgi:transposase-like protein
MNYFIKQQSETLEAIAREFPVISELLIAAWRQAQFNHLKEELDRSIDKIYKKYPCKDAVLEEVKESIQETNRNIELHTAVTKFFNKIRELVDARVDGKIILL